jgi:hypothetical protein
VAPGVARPQRLAISIDGVGTADDVALAEGDRFAVTVDTTLYAVWAPQGASGSPAPSASSTDQGGGDTPSPEPSESASAAASSSGASGGTSHTGGEATGASPGMAAVIAAFGLALVGLGLRRRRARQTG